MRISTQQQYLNSIDNMQRSQSNLSRLNDQITTGKKLLKPSDDPVAAAQVVKLERELAQYEKFDDNINVTQRRLELEETILDDINTAIDRMRELGLRAGNGTLTDADRGTIATELLTLTEYVAGLMNTQDAQGEYLFAGSKGGTRPYESLQNMRYDYRGDDGQRLIQVSPDLFVPSNDSGKYLFEAVDDQLSVDLTGEAVANGDVFITIPPAGALYTSDFPTDIAEENFLEATKGLGDLTLTVTEPTPGNYEYQITDSGGAVVVANTAFTPGDSIDFNGLQFDLAAPANMLENSIRLTTSAEKKNILDVAVDLAEALQQPTGDPAAQLALSEAVATSLTQFTEAQERNVEARAALGARLSSLEKIRDSNQDFELFTKSALSSLVDADMAEAASLFKMQKATLEASQITFSQISQLSLFNFIR